MIKEYKYPIICFFAIAILHLSSLNIGFGFVILGLVLVLSSINPLAFIVTGVGAQLLTYPLGISIQFAQLQIFSFILISLFSGIKYTLDKRIFSFHLILFSVLGAIFCLLNDTIDLFVPILTGILYYIIVSVQLQNCTYPITTILTVFASSTFLAGIGFWSSVLGIETVSEFYEANSIRDIVRLGSGNADANSVGITIPIGILGLNALLISNQNLFRNKKNAILLTICVFLFGVPVVLSTGSRTSLIILVLGYLLLLGASLKINLQNRMHQKKYIKKSISWTFYFFIGICGLVVIYFSEAAQKVLSALQNINSYEEEAYSSGIASGRSALWIDFGEIVIKHPIFGCPSDLRFLVNDIGIVDFGKYQAHNTYLEIASLLGIPLSVLFFSFFFKPIKLIYSKNKISDSLPIYAISFVFFISFFAFSAHSWKLFYMFLAILGVFVNRNRKINYKV